MSAKTLLVATTNQGKLKEFVTALAESEWQIFSLEDNSSTAGVDVEETGSTFQENAELKARTYAKLTNRLTVAEDSGLVVAALNGAPGVYSKRFHPGSDADRNAHLLTLLQNSSDRAAYFITVICLFDPATKEVVFFEGKVNGSISTVAQGEAGFGYDPIFIPEEYTETFAELGPSVKSIISHRGRAIAKLKAYLQKERS